jgi:hypothetical protein
MKTPHHKSAFTLLETVLAIGLLGMLAAALYAASMAALEAAKTTMDDQAWQERTESFLRGTRRALMALPGNAKISLRYETGAGAATPELVFFDSGSYFGIPAVKGGRVVLTAPAQSDGTRTFGILRVPKGETSRRTDKWQWFPLLSKVEKVEWAVWDGAEWKTEWPEGAERPQLLRLRFTSTDGPAMVQEHFFWIPKVAPLPASSGRDSNEAPNPNLEVEVPPIGQ